MRNLPTRPLGDSGLEAPVVGLGCNNFGGRMDLTATVAVLDAALAEGVTFLDTADRYGETRSEQFIGEWLPAKRDEVVLATKFGADTGDGYVGSRGSADYIPRAVEASLRRLQTDTIDLYWYHRPDGVTPIAETLEALDALVRAGTVRAIGASNFSATQIADADRVARERGFTRFCAIQNEYSLLARDAETDVLPLCERLGIAFIPFFPLASGLLTGKYRRGVPAPAGTRLADRRELATDAQWALVEGLTDYARERGLALTEVAIGALLAQPAVSSVIAGATTPEQVRSNAEAGSWIPSETDQTALSGVLDGHER
jgi:aryl-alcohol dehydrogenase-like predicted oxidoreductase